MRWSIVLPWKCMILNIYPTLFLNGDCVVISTLCRRIINKFPYFKKSFRRHMYVQVNQHFHRFPTTPLYTPFLYGITISLMSVGGPALYTTYVWVCLFGNKRNGILRHHPHANTLPIAHFPNRALLIVLSLSLSLLFCLFTFIFGEEGCACISWCITVTLMYYVS